MLVVFAVVARELVAVETVDIDHITESLAEAHVTVIIDTIADEHLSVVTKYGTVHQTGLLEFGVVVAHLGVDMTLARGDVGGSDDMGHGVAVVVVEGVRGDEELGTLHLHVVVEDRHLRLRVVLAPVRGECGVTVDHLASLEEIGIVVETVEVEAVGIKGGLAVLQHYIITGTSNLIVTVVVGVVAEERERVALIEFHMTKGLEGVADLVEIGTVAIETCPLMGEVHLTVEDRGVGIQALVVVEHVGVDEVDAGVLNLRPSGGTLSLFLGISIETGVAHQYTQ